VGLFGWPAVNDSGWLREERLAWAASAGGRRSGCPLLPPGLAVIAETRDAGDDDTGRDSPSGRPHERARYPAGLRRSPFRDRLRAPHEDL